MLCLKKHRLVLTLSLLALFVVPFLCSSGSVSAASYTFNYDSTSNPIPANTTFDSNFVGFSPSYVIIEISNYDAQGYFSPFNVGMPVNGVYTYRLANDSNGYSFGVVYLPANVLYYSNYFYRLTYSITLTFYDSNPTISTPCPECPPIPETPYGDILNKIYIAILAVSATALCIYFFYAFYNMFFGGIKR